MASQVVKFAGLSDRDRNKVLALPSLGGRRPLRAALSAAGTEVSRPSCCRLPQPTPSRLCWTICAAASASPCWPRTRN